MHHRELPIYELEEALVARVGASGRLILQAPTGSGKSTQVPQMLLDRGLLGDGEVVVLQPRRLPARMLATRVAEERGCSLGDEVGYQIRFDRVASERTRIRFVTEGILLRQMMGDPRLRGVSAILFDEFHERHLYGDITLARALDLQETERPDLKLIVMSATLDTTRLEDYLGGCESLRSAGRAYPVEMEYLDSPVKFEDYPMWELAASEFQRLERNYDGDALIFMPGAYEIGRTAQAIRANSDCVVLPLHGELPVAEQDAALRSYGKRKVVVATNVAETSLTIDGVRLVIDCGLAKIARYDPYRGINTLLTEKISRAAADQRAGRAGRTAPGRCLRLWTEAEHAGRAAQELPEIKRLDLAEVVLTLKAGGVTDVGTFRWLERPEAKSLARAESLLRDLGALDAESGEITAIGRRMLAFPIHPRYARMFLAADTQGCVRPVAQIAAVSQGRPLLRRGEGKQTEQDREDVLGEKADSDFFILLRAMRFAERNNFSAQACKKLGVNGIAAREAWHLSSQFLKIAGDQKLDTAEREVSDEAIRKSILAGFPDQVAKRCEPGTLRCFLVHGRTGTLARESAVRESPLMVASEVRETQGRDGLQVLLTLATAIEEDWLRELFPEAVKDRLDVSYDATQRKVIATREILFHDLLLRSEKGGEPPLEQAASLLAAEVISGACPLKNWDHAVEQWITRVQRLREWMPELGIPALGETERGDLIQQICYGAVSYREIKERPVWPVVKSWLSGVQQEWIDRFVPERITLPNERKTKIAYAASGPPVVAVKIQDLFGVKGSLFIGEGRVPLTIQVLAPNHRPIQITSNMSTFWKESYPAVRQELQRKYPRHQWEP